MTVARVAALLIAGMLAGCGGDVTVGQEPDTLQTEMTAPDPLAVGEIDDATGTQIP